MSRSLQVFAAKSQVAERFRLIALTARLTRFMHDSVRNSISTSISSALMRIATGERIDEGGLTQ